MESFSATHELNPSPAGATTCKLSISAAIEILDTVWRLLNEFCGGVAAFLGEWHRFIDGSTVAGDQEEE
jgi:hypothetical protein